ncbi:MAG: hypothetical protein QG597_822 [Actinomycetota bacterium]|nr:hypothetical protein [Actinomycetota bacterium]
MTRRDLRGPTTWATQVSLTRMAAVTVAAGLIWLGLWPLVAPPEAVPGPWLRFALLGWAMAILAATSAVWPHRTAARWMPWAAALVALIALSDVKANTALQGWWSSLELAALLVLAAGVALPIAAGVASAGVVVTTVAYLSLAGSADANAFVTTVAGAAATARVLVAAVAVILGAYLLRRASLRTDAVVAASRDRREQTESAERQRRSDRRARWFLHDSGMNSLEAIARGVPAGNEAAFRQRCGADAERWLGVVDAPAADIASAFNPAIDEASLRGVHVEAEFEVSGALDGHVLQPLVEAAGEALRNSAKHAGVTDAALRVRVGQGSVEVVVSDQGRGFDPTRRSTGFGITQSIKGRLDDAGGRATVESSPGAGTVVRLQWPAHPSTGTPAATGSAAQVLDLPTELAGLSWLPIAFVAVGALASTMVNWSSVAVPWLLLGSGLTLAVACWWLVHRWRTGTLDRADVGIVIGAVALTTVAMPIADPFCSAATGPPLVPDGRLVALALLGVLLASWRASSLTLALALSALAVAAAMWFHVWPPCSLATVPTAMGLLLVAVAGLFLGRAVRTQQRAAWRAFEADQRARLELARLRADDLVRSQWRFAAVDEARAMLQRIADPHVDLRDPRVRGRAHEVAARLRSAVRASELPSDLGTVLMGLIDDGRRHGYLVSIDGDLGEVASPGDPRVAAVSAELRQWWNRQPAGARGVRVTLSDFDGTASVLAHVELPEPVRLPSSEPEAEVTSAGHSGGPTLSTWADDSGRWWQAEWSTVAPPETA